MRVKVFAFRLRITDPLPRSVAVRGALYLADRGRLRAAEKILERAFSWEEDALDFDSEFGSALELSSADVMHAIDGGEFECSVSVYDVEGVLLKVYDVLEGGVRFALLIVVNAKGEAPEQLYCERLPSAGRPEGVYTRVAPLLGVPEEEIRSLLTDAREFSTSRQLAKTS